MKTFLLCYLLTTLTTMSSAFAQSVRSEWSAIRLDRRVSILQPEFTKQFGPAGIFNICYDDDEFKSITPVNVCTIYRESKVGIPNSEIGQTIIKKCIERVPQDIQIARTVTRDVCKTRAAPTEFSSNECLEWTSVTSTLPLNYKLPVVNIVTEGNEMFKKGYDIPKCD